MDAIMRKALAKPVSTQFKAKFPKTPGVSPDIAFRRIREAEAPGIDAPVRGGTTTTTTTTLPARPAAQTARKPQQTATGAKAPPAAKSSKPPAKTDPRK